MTSQSALSLVSGIRPLYVLPDDPLVGEVLVPCFSVASAVDTMVGFFNSKALRSIAPGLATFINSNEGRLRLVISPYLSAADRVALENATTAEGMVCDYFDGLMVTADELEKHTLRCLTWLIKTGRIEIKIALMEQALFHPKVWLFRDQEGSVLAVHGSSNASYSGLEKNVEQVAISLSWGSSDQTYTTDKLVEEFYSLWHARSKNCIVVDLPNAVKKQLLTSFDSNRPPTEAEAAELYQKVAGVPAGGVDLPPLLQDRFEIPEGLEYETGPFAHQGEAVAAWCAAGHRGTLEMATGAGKTVAAMISAHRLYQADKPLLVVVSAPYIPLVEQWCDEVKSFGVTPVNLTRASGVRGRGRELGRVRRRLSSGQSDVAVVVVSHATLSMQSFQEELRRFDGITLLVADEAHNLGSAGFISNLPDFFDHRLGLSATPVRQYDEEGTRQVFDFLGPVVYRYTLEQAIGNCLVEYDYHVHPVELTREEMEQWYDLTARIRRNAWRDEEGNPDSFLVKLLRDRRAILENATAKVDALSQCLNEEDLRELRHILVYTSDKDPRQMEAVNEVVKATGLLFSPFTYAETAHRDEAMRILDLFKTGTIRILTAKRVLDEGVNIPQVQKAFILASTTVERQWVQRRGRLLRRCDEIGKTHSVIHDFVALPPDLDNLDDEARRVVHSELTRVREFARLARNAGREDGPLPIIERMVAAAYL